VAIRFSIGGNPHGGENGYLPHASSKAVKSKAFIPIRICFPAEFSQPGFRFQAVGGILQ
jgi:hypothetical protein